MRNISFVQEFERRGGLLRKTHYLQKHRRLGTLRDLGPTSVEVNLSDFERAARWTLHSENISQRMDNPTTEIFYNG